METITIREKFLQSLESNNNFDIYSVDVSNNKKLDIQQQLKKIQEGQKSRLLTLNDILNLLDNNKNLIKELSKYTNNFYLEYMEGDFKKGYSYNGSGFIATFTTSGNLKTLEVKRNKNRGINRLVVNLNNNTELEKKLLRKMFNINSAGTILL